MNQSKRSASSAGKRYRRGHGRGGVGNYRQPSPTPSDKSSATSARSKRVSPSEFGGALERALSISPIQLRRSVSGIYQKVKAGMITSRQDSINEGGGDASERSLTRSKSKPWSRSYFGWGNPSEAPFQCVGVDESGEELSLLRSHGEDGPATSAGSSVSGAGDRGEPRNRGWDALDSGVEDDTPSQANLFTLQPSRSTFVSERIRPRLIFSSSVTPAAKSTFRNLAELQRHDEREIDLVETHLAPRTRAVPTPSQGGSRVGAEDDTIQEGNEDGEEDRADDDDVGNLTMTSERTASSPYSNEGPQKE